jgi:outer membrane receptor protein involved in Fe transport
MINPAGAIVKTNNLIRGETPIPKSSFSSAGIFVQDEARLLNDRLTLIAGGRVDGIVVENEAGTDIDYLIVNGERNDTPPNQRITFPAGKNNTLSWSANTGMLYRLTGETDLTLNLARSFRAPSLEELFKYIDLGNFVSLGDPGLKPENGTSADVGIRIWKPKFNLQVNGFVNRIGNLVVETPGEFIYTLNTGPLEGTTDTLPALIYGNVSKAVLYGADFGMQYNVWPNVVVAASGSYVRGRETAPDTDLPGIPPLNGRLGVRYTLPKYGSAELTMVNAARQEKIAAGEKATDGFTRFDLAFCSSRIHLGSMRLQLFAGIDNLTDRSYTNHLATNRGSISVEPGRNLYLRLNLAF